MGGKSTLYSSRAAASGGVAHPAARLAQFRQKFDSDVSLWAVKFPPGATVTDRVLAMGKAAPPRFQHARSPCCLASATTVLMDEMMEQSMPATQVVK